jgi:hypothetical protein
VPRNEGWPERLMSTVVLKSAADLNPALRRLLRAAWNNS